MIEYYKKPSVKFIVNKGNFNKLMGILEFQKEKIPRHRFAILWIDNGRPF